MPTAKQRRTHMTPVLQYSVSTKFAAYRITRVPSIKVRCSLEQYRAADSSHNDMARFQCVLLDSPSAILVLSEGSCTWMELTDH